MGPKGRARAGGAVGTWYNSFYIVRVAQFRDGTGGSGRWRRNMVQQLLHSQGGQGLEKERAGRKGRNDFYIVRGQSLQTERVA